MLRCPENMERRGFLASLAPFIVFPGCVSDASKRSPEGESSTTTDDCGWPQFCKGSTIVEVRVSSRFSGEVVLETECRGESFEIQPGETKTITRQVDAETCDIALSVDNQEAYSDTVQNYESTTLEVNSSGEVYDETIEL